MHNVLDPHGTSVNVAGRRAERRGPKTCLQKSRTWNQLAPCGLQPGPLALSCMAMTMHTGESLALFHSHADSFVLTNDFWSGQFLWAMAMDLSQMSCRHSWGSSSRSLLAFVCALGMSATIPCAAVTCDYHVKVSPRTHEQLRDKKTLCCALTSWSTVSHMAGGALPTASGDPGVVVFCCEPGPVIANVLELSRRRNLLLAFCNTICAAGTIVFRVTAIAC